MSLLVGGDHLDGHGLKGTCHLSTLDSVLEMRRSHWHQIVALAQREAPLECCGLLIGMPDSNRVEQVIPVRNEDQSPTSYRLDGADYARAALAADDAGFDILGVVHSHPTTAAYPSPTDVAGAAQPLVPPSWYWVIVSLAASVADLRIFRIAPDGSVDEVPIALVDD
jgi:proteasome lid subunit RPN8/RPN11